MSIGLKSRFGTGVAAALVALAACGGSSGGGGGGTGASTDPFVAQAKVVADKATQPVTVWDGPTTGPKAQPGKFIVYVSESQQNGGASGVGAGVQEAAAAIGWKFKLIDGQGTVQGQTAAMNQAIALKPDGIVLGTLDAQAVKTAVVQANQLGIKVVGWHSAATPGPIADPPVYMNVQSDQAAAATAMGDYVVASSNGKAQVAIVTWTLYQVAILKTTTMRGEIEKCRDCKVLTYDDSPLTEASTRMPSYTSSLLSRFSKTLTHVMFINDGYADFMAPALRAAGIGPGGPPVLVSTGDGSVPAYQRIRDGQYQTATVPEPLNEHGWQVVDELNRAFAGEPPSTYVTPIHLVIKANIGSDGGPDNRFDPGNGYRDQYKKIWGV